MDPKLSDAVSFMEHSFRLINFHVHPIFAWMFLLIYTFLSVKNIAVGVLYGESFPNLQIFLIVFGSVKLFDIVICVIVISFDHIRQWKQYDIGICFYGFVDAMSIVWIVAGIFWVSQDIASREESVIDTLLTITMVSFQMFCLFANKLYLLRNFICSLFD
jgi:hypothetical protein